MVERPRTEAPSYAPPIRSNPLSPNEPRRFGERLGDTLTTLFRETVGRGCPAATRVRRLIALSLAALTQLLDRGRVLIFLLPLTFDRSLRFSIERDLGATVTAAVAGGAVAAVFFSWGWLVGHSFHWSLREYPATTRVFLRNHPAAVGLVSTAIDGFPKAPADYDRLGEHQRSATGWEFGPYATKSTRSSMAFLALTRGLKTAFIFGTTAHVGVAKISGFSDRAVRRRTLVVALEAALVLGMVAVLVSTLISFDFLGAAERVRDVITDRRVLLTISAVVIVASAADNFVRRRRLGTATV